MENARTTKTSATQSQDEKMTCWQTATSPECLRLETPSEVHLFPYGYFCRAQFSRDGSGETIEIQFQETLVIIKGKGLDPLFDALARLGIERIQIRPDKYAALSTGGLVSDIEIRTARKENRF